MRDSIVAFESSVEYDLFSSEIGSRILTKYQILQLLHMSEHSSVYLMRHLNDDELYTLKVFSKIDNIHVDLKKIKNLSHPGLALIVDFGESEKYQYVIKRYVAGETLKQYIDKCGPMDENTVKRIASQLIDVFEYLHTQSDPVIYRDLKPENIVMDENFDVVLIDIEMMRHTVENQTTDTFYVGTHGYASPEQYGFQQSDARSDIYTIGATLYFILGSVTIDG